jgi:hypothetical protein
LLRAAVMLPRVAFPAVQVVNSMTYDKLEAARDEGNHQLSNSRNIISREQAKALGLKHYFRPCKHGHIAERYVSSAACSECSRVRTAKWDAANRDHHNEKKRKYRAAHPEKLREREREAARKHRAADPEGYSSQQAAWRAANKEKIAAYKRQWYVKNGDEIRRTAGCRRRKEARRWPSAFPAPPFDKCSGEGKANEG